MLDLTWLAISACIAMVFLGAVVQGTLGIGLGMVASPVLALVDRDFIPAAVLVAVIPLTIGVALGERSSIDRRGAGFALIGRVPGSIVGAAAVAWATPRSLVVLVAVSVLLAVLASLLSVQFRTTDRAVFVAGVASGFTGTTTGVGGPPMALTYQHGDPAVMRATLSAFFTIGSILSLLFLLIAGQMSVRQMQLGLLLVPGTLIGFFVSRRFAPLLRTSGARAGILVLCAASAIALLIEEFAL